MVAFLILTSLLTPVPPNVNSLWGLEGGESRADILAKFSPAGNKEAGRWTVEQNGAVDVLRYECAAKNRCFSHPSRGEFFLVGDRLASFSFYFNREAGPDGVSVRTATASGMRAAGLTKPAAAKAVVGRRTQYFLWGKKTVLWVQDGPDAEIKLYIDAHNPVGRAEAVAAGASSSLKTFPGATQYSRAHGHIISGRYERARRELEEVLAQPKASVLLSRQARYVLAMVLAARAKTWIEDAKTRGLRWQEKARKYLRRAGELAPSLNRHFKGLGDQIKTSPKP